MLLYTLPVSQVAMHFLQLICQGELSVWKFQHPTRCCCQSVIQGVSKVSAAVAEPQASAAVAVAPKSAARPSWVRKQQQPTAMAPPAAKYTSDTDPATQLYPAPHGTSRSPPDHVVDGRRVAGRSDHVIRPWEARIATGVEAATEAGIEAGAAVQAGSTEEQAAMACQTTVTDKAAQRTHKPLVFDIEDSCDEAVREGDQAQPAFVIDIDDFPFEPSARVACDLAPVSPSSAPAGSRPMCKSSPSRDATAQPPPAAPNHTQQQAALVVTSITSPSTADEAPAAYAAACVAHGQQQATQQAHRPSGLNSPCLEPCPTGPAHTDVMGMLPIDFVGPVPTDAMGSFSVDAMGPVPTDAMTVPDTPPYSHASHVGSPIGPTWLSPMLTRQQPGQGKQYSPSMLGRPAGMRHMDSSLTHAATVAAMQVQPSEHVGAYAAQAQQPLLSEGQRVRAVAPSAACAGDVQPQGELGRYIHPHRQSQTASQLPGSIQVAAAGKGRSPGCGIAEAATGVFTTWNRQGANQSGAGSPDAAMPQSNVEQLQDSRQQLGSSATLAALPAQPSARGSVHGQPASASSLQRHQEDGSAAAQHMFKEAAATHADPVAKESAKLNERLCRAEEAPHQAKAASILHNSPKVLFGAPASTELNFYKLSSGQTSDHCFLCRHLLYLQMLHLLQTKMLAVLLLLLLPPARTRLLLQQPLHLRSIRSCRSKQQTPLRALLTTQLTTGTGSSPSPRPTWVSKMPLKLPRGLGPLQT